MTSATPTRGRVGIELARLRSLSGLSGRQVAARIGISQPTLSRIEAGDGLPSLPVARAWLDVVQADDAAATLVLALVETGHSETVAYRQRLRADRHMQGHVLDLEAQARAMYCVDPVIVPGLLQVQDYAIATMRLADTEGQIDQAAALQARLRRQDRMYDGDRTFGVVLVESALRVPWMTAAQLHRLADLAGGDRPHITVGIVPASVSWPAVPWNNFVLFDLVDGESVVCAELIHGEAVVTGEEEVRLYRRLYDEWLAVAVTGDDAARLCQQIAATVT